MPEEKKRGGGLAMLQLLLLAPAAVQRTLAWKYALTTDTGDNESVRIVSTGGGGGGGAGPDSMAGAILHSFRVFFMLTDEEIGEKT